MTSSIDQCDRESLRFEFTEVQTVSITLDGDDHRSTPRLMAACLLNLSSQGAKLVVPSQLPVRKKFRLKLTVQQFALEFYVAAKVCWAAPDGEKGSVIGCQFDPSLPDGLLDHLAAGGKLDRRGSDREKSSLAIKIVRERTKGGTPERITLQNYSAGGLCIEVRRPMDLGERFHIFSERLETAIAAVAHWQVKQSGVYVLGCGYVEEMDFERLERALRPTQQGHLEPT